MDDIPAQRPAIRRYVECRRHIYSARNRTSYNGAPSRSSRRWRRVHKAPMHNVSTSMKDQAANLRSARTTLERCCDQEQIINDFSGRNTGLSIEMPQITAARERSERRYINSLIRYLRGTQQISVVEAREMQGSFARRKRGGAGVTNRTYLLSMFPRELL